MALAIENKDSLLLLDESDARKIAAVYNVKVIGTIGLLIRAHFEKKIDSLQNELDKLIDVGGFRISKPLYEKLIKAAKL